MILAINRDNDRGILYLEGNATRSNAIFSRFDLNVSLLF
jgi:hypothetical protein